jgi:hypothetical protein
MLPMDPSAAKQAVCFWKFIISILKAEGQKPEP